MGKGITKGAAALANKKGGAHLSKRKARGGDEVVFDPDAHREWITGFSKRKKQRQKAAEKALEAKAARARLADRKKRQTELRDKYRQIMGDDADQEEHNHELEQKVLKHLKPLESTTEYTNGTQVIIEPLGLGEEEEEPLEEEASDDDDAQDAAGPSSSSATAAGKKKAAAAVPGKKGTTNKQSLYAKGLHTKGAGGKKKKKNLNGGKGMGIKKHKGKPRK